MRIRLRYRNIFKFRITPRVFFSISGIALTYLLLFRYLSGNSTGSGLLFGLIIAFAIINLTICRSYRPSKTIIYAILLSVVMTFSALLHDYSPESAISLVMHMDLWIFVLILANLHNYQKDTKRQYVFISAIYIIGSFIAYQGYLYSDYSIKGKFYEITAAYYLLGVLPVAFLIPSKPLRYIAVTGIVLACVMSFKRTIFVTLAAILFLYLILYKDKKTVWIKLAIVALSFFMVGMLISSENSSIKQIMNIWLGRFFENKDSMLGERGGVFKDVFGLIINSNPLDIIAGHGYFSVQKFTSSGFSAHNDFFEIFFDYGVFAFVLYIMFIFSLIKRYVKLKKQGDSTSFSFMVALCVFIIPSMFSHLLTYPTHFMLLAMYFGWCLPQE